MRFYRCRCGSLQSWSSMGVAACVSCHECGSDLAESPEGHGAVEPHQWVTRYEPTTGKPYEVCERCLDRKDTP